MNRWIASAACCAAMLVIGCTPAEEAPAEPVTKPENQQSEAPKPESEMTQAAMVKCPMCNMEFKQEDMKDVAGTMYCADCAAKAAAAPEKPDDAKPAESEGTRGASPTTGG